MDMPTSRGSRGAPHAADTPPAAAPKRADTKSKPASRGAPRRADSPPQRAEEDREPAPRRRGRPAIGNATKIRLGELEEFAQRLGEGNVAEGVRRALEFTRQHTPGEAALVPVRAEREDVESVVLPTELAAEVRGIGNGSLSKGLTMLVKAARVLTHEGIRKLGKG